MFRSSTRALLFDHTATSSSMNRLDDTSDAVARSPARAPFHPDVNERRPAWRQAREIPRHLCREVPAP